MISNLTIIFLKSPTSYGLNKKKTSEAGVLCCLKLNLLPPFFDEKTSGWW